MLDPMTLGVLIGAAVAAISKFKDTFFMPEHMTFEPEPVELEQRRPASAFGVSAAGITLIQRFESLRLQAYDANPPKNDWTIGWGHKLRAGERFPNGITRAQADELLRADLSHAERRVRTDIRYSVTQGEYDALVSAAFNLTTASWSKMAARLNRGEPAADVFPLYVYGGGVRLAGLITRRNAELSLYTA